MVDQRNLNLKNVEQYIEEKLTHHNSNELLNNSNLESAVHINKSSWSQYVRVNARPTVIDSSQYL